MDYGAILARAWRITWNYKILWVFGFLAGLGSGGGGGNSSANFSTDGQPTPGGGFLPPEIQRQLERPEMLAVFIAIACVLVILAIALFVLSIIGRGGLIGGIRQAEDKSAVTFGEAWAIGTNYFWRLLGVELILLLAGLIIGGLGGLAGLVGALTLGAGLCLLLPVLCLLVLALIPLAIVAYFAQFGIVLEDLPVTAAFRRAWEVLKANLGPILILGVIMFVINLIASLLLAAPLAAVVAPGVVAFMADPQNPNMALIGVTGLGLLCLLPVAIVLGSLLTTWSFSVWTLAYRQLTANNPPLPPTPAAPPPYQPA